MFVREPVHPEPDLAQHPGTWRVADEWPPPGYRMATWTVGDDRTDRLVVRGDVGVAAWNSCAGSLPWGQPLDQRADNAASLTYDWPVTERAELLGNGSVRLRVRSDQTYGHVSVKLCDVSPDGTSALITRGMLDLTHRGCWPADRQGVVGAEPAPLTPGEWIDVDIELEATTWTLTPGHVLRLAVAGTDWPNCWPPPGPVTLDVDAASVIVALPVVDGLAECRHDFGPGEGPDPADADGVVWRIEHDVLARETAVVTHYGGTYPGGHGATVTDDYCGRLTVSTDDPGRASATGTARFEIVWPDVSCRTEATLSVRSEADEFHVDIELTVWEHDTEIAHRNWHLGTPGHRNGG